MRGDESDFRLLWTGDIVSQIGSQITLFALPYLAVVALRAGGGQIGPLQALYTLPFLLVPLAAGVWLERRSLRSVLVATNLGCAVLVLSVPLLAAAGRLSLTQLYVIAVLGGAATVTAEIAKLTLVPQLVRADRLATANSRLGIGIAVGITAGPGLAGLLTGAVGAPFALIVDGATYVFCVATVLRIRHREPAHRPPPGRDLRAELADGLRTVFGTPPVRWIAIHAALFNAAVQVLSVAVLLYFVRDLGFGGGAYGVVLLCGGVGAVLGSLAAPALIRRLGHGRAMLGALGLCVNAFWFLPLAHGGRTVTVVWFALTLLVGLIGSGVGGVVATTVRQLLTPVALHRKMNGSYQMVNFGAIPVGALVGGALADRLGAHTTLWVAAAVLVVAVTPLAARPVRSLGPVLVQAEPDPLPTD